MAELPPASSPAVVIGRHMAGRVKRRLSLSQEEQDVVYGRMGQEIVAVLEAAGYQIVKVER